MIEMPRARMLVALGTVALAVLVPVAGGAADRYVAIAGSDTGNACLSAGAPCGHIARAIGQAASGDVINVAEGKYRENLRIDFSTDLTFLGGWDAQFAVRDPSAHPTLIRSGKVKTAALGFPKRDRIWSVHAPQAGVDITVVLDGFVLTRGYATSQPPTPTNDPNDHWEDGGALDATARGGTVHVTLSHSTVTKNKSELQGGALSAHAFNGGSATLVLDDVIITRNTIKGFGGAVALASANAAGQVLNSITFSATNCIIANNRDHGVVRTDQDNEVFGAGALFVSSYSEGGAPGALISVQIVNSTLVANKSKVVGGINVLADGGPGDATTVDLRNTILTGNHDDAGDRDVLMQGETSLTVNADHCVIGARSTILGTFNDLGGNLSVDPGLDPTYHLAAGSPAIDAGTCTGAPAADIDADPRPSGSGCDIGADEFVP